MSRIEEIRQVLSMPTCIVGMGNYLKQDDAVGLYIVDRLNKDTDESVSIMNVEDIIEGYVFKIAEGSSEHVIVIDAISTGAPEGSVFFGPLRSFNETLNDLSTHKLSLKMSGEILERHNKKVYLLGISVKNADFGEGLSAKVTEQADIIIEFINEILSRGQKECVYEH